MRTAPHIFLAKHVQGPLTSSVHPQGPRSRAWDTPDTSERGDVYDAADYLWHDTVYPTHHVEQVLWRLGDWA